MESGHAVREVRCPLSDPYPSNAGCCEGLQLGEVHPVSSAGEGVHGSAVSQVSGRRGVAWFVLGFAFFATLGAHSFPSVFLGIDAGVSVAGAFVLFGALFRFLPETRVTNREAALSVRRGIELELTRFSRSCGTTRWSGGGLR